MRRTRAEIDLQALKYNVDGIRKRIGPNVKIMGIVKANAYGHGMCEVAKALVRFGCEYLGVSFLEEGIELREHDVTVPMLVLGGVLGSQISEFLEYDLDVTISSLELADRVNIEAQARGGKKARVHLKIDTGMERMGVRAEHALSFVEHTCRLKYLEVAGIYSHLATSDEHDKSFAYAQIERFDNVLREMQKASIEIPDKHIANSGAIIDLTESYYTMVRPGIMLYGYYPSRETTESIPLRPALSLKSEVGYLKEVPANTSISYGRKYFTSSLTKVATIPIGYGDGYSRRLTNQTEVLIRGKRFPVVGTICMDQIMADVGVDSHVSLSDEVVLIGRQGDEEISAWQISEKLKTIPYEVLTGILPRVPRVYIN